MNSPNTRADIEMICHLLRRYVYACSTEEVLHNAVIEALKIKRICYEHEKVLSPNDRIDFYLPEFGLGIECKITGGNTSIMRQLFRYAEHELILGIILVTSRHSHNVPPELNTKPVERIYTGFI